MHLMLHGRLSWFEEKNTQKYTLAEFHFANGINLALTDFQSNARISLNPEKSSVPDALSKQATTAFWKKILQSKATIKNLLLDQHIIRGIGNAYADEILWEAGISPFSRSDKIPATKIAAFAKAVKSVLKMAEKKIMKAEPDIIGGEIRDFMVIHNAKKKKSPSGGTIKIKTAGGRKTYYTEEQIAFT